MREFRWPALARQRVRELSSFYWATLNKLMFVAQRQPDCVFAQLNNDILRVLAAITTEELLRTEGHDVRGHAHAPWQGLLEQLPVLRVGS
eukprot:6846283-Prymnesium_polylepis.1